MFGNLGYFSKSLALGLGVYSAHMNGSPVFNRSLDRVVLKGYIWMLPRGASNSQIPQHPGNLQGRSEFI